MENKPKYKIGDKVKIKSWERMVKEYGTDSDGDIDIKPHFRKDMRKHCGCKMKIKDILVGSSIIFYEMHATCGWAFTEKMFEGNK